MEAINRNPGYYWVRVNTGWVIMQTYGDGAWYSSEIVSPIFEHEDIILEIDPKQITREGNKTFQVPSEQAEAYRQSPYCKAPEAVEVSRHPDLPSALIAMNEYLKKRNK